MNVKELQEKLEGLRAELAELKAGERTAENAEKIVAKRDEITATQAELDGAVAAQAEIDAAFADADGDEAPAAPAEGGDGGEGDGAGEALSLIHI